MAHISSITRSIYPLRRHDLQSEDRPQVRIVHLGRHVSVPFWQLMGVFCMTAINITRSKRFHHGHRLTPFGKDGRLDDNAERTTDRVKMSGVGATFRHDDSLSSGHQSREARTPRVTVRLQSERRERSASSPGLPVYGLQRLTSKTNLNALDRSGWSCGANLKFSL